MDIQAVYKSRTSLRPFVVEYLGLASSQLSSQANQRQDVDVILKLGGTLYNPAVTFNLAFPNLVGDLATLADSKLRLLQNNELELNSQVFGLIMFNNFCHPTAFQMFWERAVYKVWESIRSVSF